MLQCASVLDYVAPIMWLLLNLQLELAAVFVEACLLVSGGLRVAVACPI